MRRVTAKLWGTPTAYGTLALVVTAGFFVLGSLLGCLLILQADGAGAEALETYLTSFLAAAGEEELQTPELPAILWRTLRWPVGAVLLGFTSLGLAGIPLLSMLRGFLLTFSVGAFVRMYGQNGVRIAFCLLGVTGLISVPVFLLLSAQSFLSAMRLAAAPGGQTHKVSEENPFPWQVGCAAALTVCILLERYVIPLWMTSMAATAFP